MPPKTKGKLLGGRTGLIVGYNDEKKILKVMDTVQVGQIMVISTCIIVWLKKDCVLIFVQLKKDRRYKYITIRKTKVF